MTEMRRGWTVSRIEEIEKRWQVVREGRNGAGRGGTVADSKAPGDIEFLLSLVRAVTELHQPRSLPKEQGEHVTCVGCNHIWPCPTFRAVSEGVADGSV